MELIQVNLADKTHCDAVVDLLNHYMLDEMGIGEAMPEGLGTTIIDGLKKHSAYLGFLVKVDSAYAALANCNLNFSTWKARSLIFTILLWHPSSGKKELGFFF